VQPLGFSRRAPGDTKPCPAVSPIARRLSSPIERVWMGTSCRLFVCARCGTTVLICSQCDRGNRYDGTECSEAARRHSVREAGRRYQQSPAGAACHARRQKRFRTRQAEFCAKHDASRFTPPPASATDAIAAAAPPNEAILAITKPPTEARPASETQGPPRPETVQAPRPVAVCVAWPPHDRRIPCDFCGRRCDPPARNDFIRRRGPPPSEELDEG
jgi:hypothetical protein